jgi:hypothetical protein
MQAKFEENDKIWTWLECCVALIALTVHDIKWEKTPKQFKLLTVLTKVNIGKIGTGTPVLTHDSLDSKPLAKQFFNSCLFHYFNLDTRFDTTVSPSLMNL